MSIDTWKSQLRKGASEFAILSTLESQSLSGIEMLNHLMKYVEIGLSDGTLYPLLKRLERTKRIKASWQLPNNNEGSPKKTYLLTQDGKAALQIMRETWVIFKSELSDITGNPK